MVSFRLFCTLQTLPNCLQTWGVSTWGLGGGGWGAAGGYQVGEVTLSCGVTRLSMIPHFNLITLLPHLLGVPHLHANRPLE